VHPLAQRVLSHIRRQELLKAGNRVGVAVSGGIDSVALLRLLLELRGELGIVLSVVHFDHKLRGTESDADEEFVTDLAREHDLEFHIDSEDVARVAAEEHVSVEAAARDVRYGFFRRLLRSGETNSPLFPKPGRSGAPSPPKGGSQGLKPLVQNNPALRGPEGPLFHVAPGVAAESRTLSRLNKIVTGHTLDDQAETVLMRMIRGAGLRGLGGIYPRIPVEGDDGEICGEIVRPLLGIRRQELRQYLGDIGQGWREDSTNTDESLTRNRVRRLVLPLLEKEFNRAVAENLSELAEIAREEEDYWENEIAGWMGTAVHWSKPEWAGDGANALVQIERPDKGCEPNARLVRREKRDASRGSPRSLASQKALARDDKQGITGASLQSSIAAAPRLVMNASVSRLWFLGEPAAVQRRVVKAIGEQAGIPLEFKHVEEILRFAEEEGASGRELSLPLGWKVRREPDEIVFLTPDLRGPVAASGYEYELPIPGIINVHETGSQIQAQRVPADAMAGYNSDELLDTESLSGPLRVRNWHPGDRFWPAHTKSPKKIKELLQERHVPQAERGLWPVIVKEDAGGEEIVWVRGFRVPAKLRAKQGREAILILEKLLAPAPAS